MKGNLQIDGKTVEGVYIIDTGTIIPDLWAFNKKLFPTKEDALNKFSELNDNAEYDDITEQFVRFGWWTEDHSHYEYPGEDIRKVCGYRITDKGGKGSMACWIIHQYINWGEIFGCGE